MIEINLVPDVKQELIKAERVRASVISLSIIVGIGAVGVVVMLAIWVFGVQYGRGILADQSIATESKKLAQVTDLPRTLTIQHQLSLLSAMHDTKSIDSRIFDVLSTINPPAPNTVAVTNLTLDSTTKTIKISAQAPNGFPALETFRKTISATTFDSTTNGQKQSVPLANQLNVSEQSYGQDATGARVLRFTISFTYPSNLFTRTAQNAVIVAPTKSNVTDSFLGVPNSLFTQKASDTQGGN
jgi:hypothetical protein